MVKDPAFLYYDADASRDVSHMNRLERGAYLDVLHAQKKFGKLTETQIKKVLGKDYNDVWEAINMILTFEEDKYFIEWLDNSIKKRKNFTESRKKNLKNKKNTDLVQENDIVLTPHMVNVNENINENKEEKENKGVQGEEDYTEWNEAIDVWIESYHKKTGLKPTIDGIQASSLKQIRKKLKNIFSPHDVWERESAINTLKKFFDIAYKDDWLKDHYLLTNLNSQFDKIILNAKRGNTKNGTDSRHDISGIYDAISKSNRANGKG